MTSPRRRPLAAAEIDDAVADLPGWTVVDGRLCAEFRFADFAAAFAFMTAVAAEAEALDHHPDWSNSWNLVSVSLRTHDVGALTPLDVDLARAIAALAGTATAP